MTVSDLSNDDLLKALERTCLYSRRMLARLLVQLGEVEARLLHAEVAYPSLFEFCVRKLGMSEGEAYRRVSGARIVRRFPALIPWLESGRLHLTTVVALRDSWTSENIDELAQKVAGKSKFDVAREIARRRPQPDAPDAIRKLPPQLEVSSAPNVEPLTTPAAPRIDEGDATRTASIDSAPAGGDSATHGREQAPLGNEARVPSRGVVKPLSEDRFKFQFTAGEGFRKKIEDVQNMLRHRNPRGDLEPIFELALDALIKQLKKERYAETERPQKTERPANADHVRDATRRAAFERDGLQCTYEANGVRCSAKGFLELDHKNAKGRGGGPELANQRVLCREHNKLRARQVYGAEHIEKVIAVRAHMRKRSRATMNEMSSALVQGAEPELRQRDSQQEPSP